MSKELCTVLCKVTDLENECGNVLPQGGLKQEISYKKCWQMLLLEFLLEAV